MIRYCHAVSSLLLPFLPSWARWWCAFSTSCRSLWFECVWLHFLAGTYLSCVLVREGSTWPIWTAWLSGVRCWCSVTDEAHFCRSSCVARLGNCFPACRQIWNSATWVDATLRNPLAGYQAARETKEEETQKALMNAHWHPGHTDFPFLKLIWEKKTMQHFSKSPNSVRLRSVPHPSLCRKPVWFPHCAECTSKPKAIKLEWKTNKCLIKTHYKEIASNFGRWCCIAIATIWFYLRPTAVE